VGPQQETQNLKRHIPQAMLKSGERPTLPKEYVLEVSFQCRSGIKIAHLAMWSLIPHTSSQSAPPSKPYEISGTFIFHLASKTQCATNLLPSLYPLSLLKKITAQSYVTSSQVTVPQVSKGCFKMVWLMSAKLFRKTVHDRFQYQRLSQRRE